MCGIIGYSGKENYDLDKIKFLMLWNSYERGKDATGIYTPSSGVLKDNDPAHRFFYLKEMKKLVPDNQLIAHVRAKTIGQNLAKNAHPFDVDDIVLAHNGTLIEYFDLATKYGMKGTDWDVDSQILAKGVSLAFKEGTTIDNLKIDAFSEYRGAVAALFYSKSLDTMFVFRDDQRPLYYAYDKNKDMYISSIDDALRALDLEDIKQFEPNNLYVIDHGVIVKQEKYKTYAQVHKEDWNGKARGREHGQRFPNVTKGQKEISTLEDDWKAYWFLGMWLLSDTQTWSGPKGYYDRIATMKKGNYYRVTGWYGEKAAVIQIKDENGTLGQANLCCFDLRQCLVQEGDVFEITTGITAKKGKEKLWSDGDRALAKCFNMDFGTIELWHEGQKRYYEINSDWCKPAGMEETLKFWEQYENTDPDKPEVPVVDTLPEETPFIEDEDKKESQLDDFISSKLYLGFCDVMDNEINALEEEYTDSKDLTPKINEIRSKILVSRDKTYLDTLSLQN